MADGSRALSQWAESKVDTRKSQELWKAGRCSSPGMQVCSFISLEIELQSLSAVW